MELNPTQMHQTHSLDKYQGAFVDYRHNGLAITHTHGVRRRNLGDRFGRSCEQN